MTQHLTYMYLLTPLHTGASVDEGNLMGIAREVHTEFPYLPASSLRGKIRAELEASHGQQAETFFGQKIKDGQQPTEGEVWFAEATLLFFPIASLSHHLVWITCPLFLERWNRWLQGSPLSQLIQQCRQQITDNTPALVSFEPDELLLQNAKLSKQYLSKIQVGDSIGQALQKLMSNNGMVNQIVNKLVVVSDEDCISLIETGLQREVKVALEEGQKTVKGGSFRSEEAIPPETILFFPWGMKPPKDENQTSAIRSAIVELMNNKLQFGGLEGLGRGWADLHTIPDNQGGA